MNQLLGLEGQDKFTPEHFVMSHTPLGDKSIVDKYSDSVILVAGPRGTQRSLAEWYKLHRFITMDEVASLFPDISYFVRIDYTPEMLDQHKKECLKRFGIDSSNQHAVE